MAAVALHIIDILIEATKLRHSREGQQEVAGPAVVDFHPLQLREGFQQLRHNQPLNVVRIPRAVHHAAAVQQTVVGGQAVVIQQIVTIFYAVVFRDQRARQLLRQRRGGDHLGAARHAAFRQLRLELIAEIGVTGDDHVAGGDLPAFGGHHRRAAVLNAGDR